MEKIGFIGAGHICQILLGNLLKKGGCCAGQLFVSDPDASKVEQIRELFGVQSVAGNELLVSSCSVVFICVHPNIVPRALESISKESTKGKILISVSAGVQISTYENVFTEAKIVRILPNPPSRIGEGAIPLVYGRNFSTEEKRQVRDIISSLGPCFEVGEEKIDIFTSVTSPAPVYAFFEAMIDSAVLCGLDEKTASEMVFQTIKGCLMMWEETNDIHTLLVEACTPAGTSVESLRVMDKRAFRSTMKEAYFAAWQKSKKFGKKG